MTGMTSDEADVLVHRDIQQWKTSYAGQLINDVGSSEDQNSSILVLQSPIRCLPTFAAYR
jgi:hypothetical protein